MNTAGIIMIWIAVQVTLFTVVGTLIYLIARRRGPAEGSLSALSVLAITVAVSLLALSPWPKWLPLESLGVATAKLDVPEDSAELATSGTTDPTAPPIEQDPLVTGGNLASRAPAEQASVWGAAWQGFVQGLRNARSGEHSDKWNWPAVVALVLLTGSAFGLARLALGLLAVSGYRKRTRLVIDAELVDLVSILCAQLGCTRKIEIRESPSIGSPATVGWRRPLLLLPIEWRGWSEEERRVVIAHEIAHVQRGDYAAWLLAQISLALHFYNPLMHWLAGRLRIEQEMAADTTGATLSGGRQSYLTTLARMALRQDHPGVSWAARPFLPARGAFLRRIEMLRDTRPRRQVPFSTAGRALLVALLAGAGILVAGLRMPFGEAVALAADNEPSKGINLKYIPSQAALVVAGRLGDLAQQPSLQQFYKMAEESGQFEQQLGLSLKDIEEVKLAFLGFAPKRFPIDLIVVRSKKPVDWSKLASRFVPKAEEASFQGKIYQRSTEPEADLGYLVADERTLVIGREALLQQIIITGGDNPEPKWADTWQQVSTGNIVAMLDTQQLHRFVKQQPQPKGPEAAVIAMVAPLWEQSERAFFATGSEMGLVGIIKSPTPAAAEKVQKTTEALFTFARNGLEEAREQLGGAPAQQVVLMGALLNAAEDLLSQAKVTREDSTVKVTSKSNLAAVPTVAAFLMPAIGQAREAARRTQSQNNLKQIALAMHNYYDKNKQFPPSAVIGPDGKTPHSWRVALLPYLDQQALYQQYKFDEPWDSANNLKVLEQMPAVYRHPNSEMNTNSSYFVLTGPKTLFHGREGTRFQDITDGTSNTIMVVEAKRDIPWTKPEDISYDADEPLPKLGGLTNKGFNAAFADGSVRFIVDSIDEQALRGLITRAGGEVVDLGNVNQPQTRPRELRAVPRR